MTRHSSLWRFWFFFSFSLGLTITERWKGLVNQRQLNILINGKFKMVQKKVKRTFLSLGCNSKLALPPCTVINNLGSSKFHSRVKSCTNNSGRVSYDNRTYWKIYVSETALALAAVAIQRQERGINIRTLNGEQMVAVDKKKRFSRCKMT